MDQVKDVSNTIQKVVTPCLDFYESIFFKNLEMASFAENGLSLLTYMIPNRFSENELQTELYNSGIGVLSTIHNFLWTRAAKKLRDGTFTLPITPGVEKQLRKTPQIVGLRLKLLTVLSIISNIELLCELVATNFNDPKSPQFIKKHLQWTVIFFIETVKFFIRFVMLVHGHGAILSYNRIPSRPTSFVDIQPEVDDETWIVDGVPIPTQNNKRPTLEQVAAVFREQNAQNRNIKQIPAPFSISTALGEFLWISRPNLYLTALFLFGKKSLVPSGVGLAIDVLSRTLQESKMKEMNISEVEELNRRRMTWFLYLIRPPGPIMWLFPSMTSDALSEDSFLSKIPGSSYFSGVLTAVPDFLRVFQSRYFYTAY